VDPDVSRETQALARRYRLPAAAPLEKLLEALEREPAAPTTVRSGLPALRTHIADSLAGLEVEEIRGAHAIADIGAGAGFPGLALAAALPTTRVDLIESVHRKAEAIERLAAAAALTNAHTVAMRSEQWASHNGRNAYDAVTSRAVGPLPVLLEYGAPLLRSGGTLVAWKGGRDHDDEAAAAVAARILGMQRRLLQPVTPYEGSRERHLHVYLKVRDTPERFPRRAGMAAKRPLAR